MALVRSLGIAIAWVVGWLAMFALGPQGRLELLAAAVVITGVVAGALVRRWWAVLLPVLVVPILATPVGYTPGAAPDYGVGLFVGAAFLMSAVPSLAAGVALGRSRRQRRVAARAGPRGLSRA